MPPGLTISNAHSYLGETSSRSALTPVTAKYSDKQKVTMIYTTVKHTLVDEMLFVHDKSQLYKGWQKVDFD